MFITESQQRGGGKPKSTDRWTDKENAAYAYNGILVFKKKGNSVTCTTCMNLESGSLSKRSLSVKEISCMSSLICGIYTSQMQRKRK